MFRPLKSGLPVPTLPVNGHTISGPALIRVEDTGSLCEPRPGFFRSRGLSSSDAAAGGADEGNGDESLLLPENEKRKEGDLPRKKQKIDPAGLTGSRRAVQPEGMKPQLASPVREPPAGENWIHELKYDGYRILCFIRGKRISLVSRNGRDWTECFSPVARALRAFPAREAVLDGEMVVLREDGTTDFQALQNIVKGRGSGRLVYYLFDIPHCDGRDLSRTPLLER